ncbi:unnamed protein product [Ilex paraguariensis]|uniref:Uncharacterized protein n=1 Tax=Ilex paraguariensis TaxID=185542 RepID=A0ABC8U7Z1_9AQUA
MKMAMSMSVAVANQNFIHIIPPKLWSNRTILRPVRCCSSLQEQVNIGVVCEPCNDKGWLLCDFCKGQKTNVKAEKNRIYRRCPSCRAIGYVLCSKCKVFKCITFPNFGDGEDLTI